MSVTNYLWEMRPYFRQVAGQFVLGSLCGIVMNTAVVLPAILLGRAMASGANSSINRQSSAWTSRSVAPAHSLRRFAPTVNAPKCSIRQLRPSLSTMP